MPLEIDRFKSLELGKRLISSGGKIIEKIETVEDLRSQPIGFSLKNDREWFVRLTMCKCSLEREKGEFAVDRLLMIRFPGRTLISPASQIATNPRHTASRVRLVLEFD